MTGKERRRRIVSLLSRARGTLTGAGLAQSCEVSRQVIVQDMALLKAEGVEILSTNRGYCLAPPSNARPRRLIKVRHDASQVAEELNLIVDLGGTVEDTVVNHHSYGRLCAPLNVSSRRDVRRFVEGLASSRSSLLSGITSGYHFHHVSAPDEGVLDEIETELGRRGFLASRTAWELESTLA